MRFWVWTGAAMLVAAAGVTPGVAAPDADPVAEEEAPPPPPPMPPLPNGHFDRPLPLGVTYGGVLGDGCHEQALPDGRLYAENSHRLMPGQTITLRLGSPDFAPVLTVFRTGEAEAPLATAEAAPDGRAVALLFTAPDEAAYVFRVAGRAGGNTGRWQVELLYGDKLDAMEAAGTDWQDGEGPSGCAAGQGRRDGAEAG